MFREGEFGADAFAGLLDIQIGPIEEPIRLSQSANVLWLKASTLKSDLVDAANFCGISVRNHVRRNILDDLRATA